MLHASSCRESISSLTNAESAIRSFVNSSLFVTKKCECRRTSIIDSSGECDEDASTGFVTREYPLVGLVLSPTQSPSGRDFGASVIGLKFGVNVSEDGVGTGRRTENGCPS
jgi:hypothetical protein